MCCCSDLYGSAQAAIKRAQQACERANRLCAHTRSLLDDLCRLRGLPPYTGDDQNAPREKANGIAQAGELGRCSDKLIRLSERSGQLQANSDRLLKKSENLRSTHVKKAG